MSRNVTAAPTNEIAIGRKINDFAIASPRAEPVGQRGEHEPDADRDERNEHDPQRAVPQRPQHALVGEHEVVVGEPDELCPNARP